MDDPIIPRPGTVVDLRENPPPTPSPEEMYQQTLQEAARRFNPGGGSTGAVQRSEAASIEVLQLGDAAYLTFVGGLDRMREAAFILLAEIVRRER